MSIRAPESETYWRLSADDRWGQGRPRIRMRTERELCYSVYVVLLDNYVGTLPQMRRRNPKRNLSKPCVYVGLTVGRIDGRFDFRRATIEAEWRVQKFGVRLMPDLYKHLNPMRYEAVLQTARKLAEDLRAKGFGVANGTCDGSQLYKSVRLEEAARK